jgi:transcriptional repressor NrdR
VKCPFCGHLADKVVDSRESKEGEAIRRRRQCLKCGRRFTSYERLDRIDYRVVKKDGRRERFDREKLMSGILKACEKLAVPVTRLEAIVDQLEQRLHDSPDKEVPTTQIGEFVMSELKSLDQVAYVRFASVYRDFKDAHEFVETIRSLLGRHDLGVSGE